MLGHFLVRLLGGLHYSLIHLLCTVHYACTGRFDGSLRCAHSFAVSLTPKLKGCPRICFFFNHRAMPFVKDCKTLPSRLLSFKSRAQPYGCFNPPAGFLEKCRQLVVLCFCPRFCQPSAILATVALSRLPWQLVVRKMISDVV